MEALIGTITKAEIKAETGRTFARSRGYALPDEAGSRREQMLSVFSHLGLLSLQLTMLQHLASSRAVQDEHRRRARKALKELCDMIAEDSDLALSA
jgi:hypothetical protein